MRDPEYRRQKLDLARWISNQISNLGDGVPQIEGKTKIKKAILYFNAKFWWIVMCFRLYSAAQENLLTWDRAILVASLFVGCDINFAMVISYEMHEQTFEDMTTLPTPCLMQRLCDKVGVTEILLIDMRVEATSITYTSMIKDSANSILAQRAQPPPTMIPAYFKGPLVLIEHVDRLDFDVDMGDHIDKLEVSMEGERPQLYLLQPRLHL